MNINRYHSLSAMYPLDRIEKLQKFIMEGEGYYRAALTASSLACISSRAETLLDYKTRSIKLN